VLAFQKMLGSKSLALAVESKVKKLSKSKKEELVKANKHIDQIIEQVRSHLTV
jgi:predicted GIY-YIG superfamily endonuclease